jgi:hypothetical protein
VVTQTEYTGAAGSAQDAMVNCPNGKIAISSGFGPADGLDEANLWRSFPQGRSWYFSWTSLDGNGPGRALLLFVVCANQG